MSINADTSVEAPRSVTGRARFYKNYPLTVLLWLRVNSTDGFDALTTLASTNGGDNVILRSTSSNIRWSARNDGAGGDNIEVAYPNDVWFLARGVIRSATDRELNLIEIDGTVSTGTSTVSVPWTFANDTIEHNNRGSGTDWDIDYEQSVILLDEFPLSAAKAMAKGRHPKDFLEFRNSIVSYQPLISEYNQNGYVGPPILHTGSVVIGATRPNVASFALSPIWLPATFDVAANTVETGAVSAAVAGSKPVVLRILSLNSGAVGASVAGSNPIVLRILPISSGAVGASVAGCQILINRDIFSGAIGASVAGSEPQVLRDFNINSGAVGASVASSDLVVIHKISSGGIGASVAGSVPVVLRILSIDSSAIGGSVAGCEPSVIPTSLQVPSGAIGASVAGSTPVVLRIFNIQSGSVGASLSGSELQKVIKLNSGSVGASVAGSAPVIRTIHNLLTGAVGGSVAGARHAAVLPPHTAEIGASYADKTTIGLFSHGHKV